MDKFDAIIRDLQTLRKSKKGWRLFGAGAHEYRVNKPLSEEELAAFEAEYGVSLPEDYREFLRRVGNGGAGPYYGVFKLGEMDNNFDHGPWGDFIGDLSKPFPHTQAWNDLPESPPEFEGEEDSPEEDEYYRQLDAIDEIYFNASNMDGAIPICHMGCALRLWLVVNGPEKGNIWIDNRADDAGIEPLQTAAQQRVTFFDWYRAWLDGALKNS